MRYPDRWMDNWLRKLHIMKMNLKMWSLDKFKFGKKEIEKLNSHLRVLQMNWVENSSEINAVSEAINHLEEQEESYWTLLSHVRWLQANDSNIAFFHQSTVQRRR